MKKEQFLAMGLTEEQADKIIADAQAAVEAKQAEIDAIKANKDTILNEKRTLKEKLDAIEAEKSQKLEDDAKTKGDVATLEAQYQAKEAQYQAKLADQQAKYDALVNTINQNTVNQTANDIATSLASDAKSAKLLQRLITSRLAIGDDGNVKVLGADGNVSIATIEDFKNEIKTSGDFDALLLGSGASGTGTQGTGAPPSPKQPHEYTEAERAQLLSTNPTLFKTLFSN